MFLHSFQKVKKSGCVLLAVLILWMTPACDYLDARHMKTVDAAGIVAGVTAVSLLKVTAAAFGVVIAAGATAKAVDSFQEWLDENGDAQSIATWNQAQAEAQSIALNESFVGSVRSWLQSRFSSLDSGEVADVAVGYQVITNGAKIKYPDAEECFLSNVTLGETYFYLSNRSRTWDGSPVIAYQREADFKDLANKSRFLHLVFFPDSCKLYELRADGRFYSCSSQRVVYFSFNRETLGFNVSSGLTDIYYAFKDSNSRWVISCPVIFTNLSSIADATLFSDVLAHATQTYNLDVNEPLATSFGSFSDANLAGLATVKLTAAGVEKIQSAVDQAVTDNTSTGDDGKPVYTPDIAQAVIDAYQQGLEDAGAVDPDVPVDPDKPVDPDEPVVPPADGILSFLQGLKSSLEAWITAIPDAIASGVGTVKDVLETGWSTLWGHLTGIGNTLMEIGETVTTGFQQVVAGITDLPGTLEGLFDNLHEWIMDIPATLSDSFASLQEWIMDIPITLTAGFDAVQDAFAALGDLLSGLTDAIPGADDITLPITDAIAEALTVDPDAVQEVVQAEKAELWNFPFLAQAKDLFDGFRFSAEVTYPKIRIETPAIIRPYYNQPEIILLDFEDYKDYCLWARLLFRAAIWLALVWHIVDLATPKLRIS